MCSGILQPLVSDSVHFFPFFHVLKYIKEKTEPIMTLSKNKSISNGKIKMESA